jgi:hypothetical protein
MNRKYSILFHDRKFHLSSDGINTFCGEKYSRNLGWTRHAPAILDEYINKIRPRCAACIDVLKTYKQLEN